MEIDRALESDQPSDSGYDILCVTLDKLFNLAEPLFRCPMFGFGYFNLFLYV